MVKLSEGYFFKPYSILTSHFKFYLESFLFCLFKPGAKHPITQVAQSMLDLCDNKLKEVSV